ncbi:hypothetical protein [Aestuariivivens insulae]|uniref:hypothetical protein n=1 Tax=Aestuariivivens insulae TaxID=1621988 RepID=UPI001F594B11|nr:hypothetical protein [Aestuariivivens insulae]
MDFADTPDLFPKILTSPTSFIVKRMKVASHHPLKFVGLKGKEKFVLGKGDAFVRRLQHKQAYVSFYLEPKQGI